MSFSEICVYQVKPDKVDEFELLAGEIQNYFSEKEYVCRLSFTKRTHRIKDHQAIKNGEPPIELKRIIKCVKYIMVANLRDANSHGRFTKLLFEQFDRRLSRCLLMPGDKLLGYDVPQQELKQ